MSADRVLRLLAEVEATGATVWVDGGWGVDALLGVQTREHGDLDLVVRTTDIDLLLDSLGAGWRIVRDLRPTAVALRSSEGLEVDLHPVSPTADGGGDQSLAGDPALAGRPPFHYPAPVAGRIGGVVVACVDAATQLAAHAGYPLRSVDVADIAALRGLAG